MQSTTRTTINQPRGSGNPTNTLGNVNTVVCRKCKSTQIVAHKKGYSFSKLFATLSLMILLPLILFFIMYFLMLNMEYSTSSAIIDGLSTVIALIGWISISLSLPVSIIVGFVGRSAIVNGCMNCGFKWTPAKRK